MPRGNIGSFNGTVTAGANMIDVFKENEKNKAVKWPTAADFCLRKIAINGTPGTMFALNGADITLPNSGVFETDEDQIQIETLIFAEAAEVCIVYLF